MSVYLMTNNYSFSSAKVRLFLKIASFFDFLAFWRQIRAVYPARLCDREGACTFSTNKNGVTPSPPCPNKFSHPP